MRSRAHRQQGHAALLMSLSIIIALTVIGVGVAQVGIADARRVAHDLRLQEAHAAAEDALNRAAARLHIDASRIRGSAPGEWMEPGRERWRTCDPTQGRPPCADGELGDVESFDHLWSMYGPIAGLFSAAERGARQSTAYYVARAEHTGEPMPGWSTLHVVAEGRSRDGTGWARLRRSFQLRSLLRRLPEAPIVAGGAIRLVGEVSLAAPEGVPMQSAGAGRDAASLLFGPAQPGALRASAQDVGDCASLGPSSHGLLWTRGDCVLSGGGAIGSAARPVVLVVESGAARIEAPLELHGILVLRSTPEGIATLRQSDGAATLRGALMADRDLELTADALSIQYAPQILRALLQWAAPPIEVPGSWTDHR